LIPNIHKGKMLSSFLSSVFISPLLSSLIAFVVLNMRFLQALSCVAALLPLASARQFVIPEVQSAVNSALGRNPNHSSYHKPSKAAPNVSPQATSHAKPKVDDSTTYWYEAIAHQGISAFGPAGYAVYRNVKDYGAKGDGSTDDTAAIQNAIAAGGRCGQNCASSTTTPGVVYFPAGTYVVSSPIFDYYYTMLIGNPNDVPTIKASSGFNGGNGGYVIDADPYFSPNLNWGSTNVFMRQVRNINIDTTAVPASVAISCIHWPTAQATSLQNMQFNMNSGSGTQHQGVFCESGSAGFMTDLVFNGGNIGLAIGNQQFTIRNLSFHNQVTAIFMYWSWSFLYSGLTIDNCQIGIDITAGGSGAQSVGSIILIDSTISNTPIGIKAAFTSSSSPATAGSVILENVQLTNVPTAVQDNGNTALTGGSLTIAGWGQGHKYTPTGPTFFEGTITPNNRPGSLLSGGNYYTRSKPQYNDLDVSQFVSARTSGAKGDGNTDDTAALQSAINSAASGGKVLFFDAGTYKITNTLNIPPGSKLVGEAYSVIMSSGNAFSDMSNPKPVVQVGNAGQSGQVEWSDMIVATQGAQAGAVLIEWNLATSGTPSGMWDVHTRVGGFSGSDLQVANCPTTTGSSNVNTNCIAAYMHMHITTGASGLYMENNWLWTADQ
jgi:glucan 1,3-beta-glucosidase